jgi:RNA-directed DNA polymerase
MSFELLQSAVELRERFFALETREAVASLLDVKYTHLTWCVYRVPLCLQYTHFLLPKKSGGNRTIMAPVSTLKLIQRKLSQVLAAVYKPKPSAHGFLRGRSIVTNAKQHAGSKYVLNLDLKDFFPSINYGRVRGMFMGTPYRRNPSVATLLAAICCADNQLPQGAPTSPIVSNMICAKMDSQLQKLAGENRCFYTRYADDITFSTDARRFPQALAIAPPSDELGPTIVGPALVSVIQSNGFEINDNKVRLQGRGARQEVTGLTTNRLPNVQRRFAAQIRAMLHAWERYGHDESEREFLAHYDHKHRLYEKNPPRFKNVVLGKLSFLAMVKGVQDPTYRKLAMQYQSLNPEFILPPTPLDAAMGSVLVLHTPSNHTQGTAFCLNGVGFVTCAHALGDDTFAINPAKPSEHLPVKEIAKEEALDLAVISVAGLVPGTWPGLEPAKARKLERRAALSVLGYPNYQDGDTGVIHSGRVTGFRIVSMIRRILTDAPIIAGVSGGPVLNDALEVVGVAATGADNAVKARQTEFNSVIPVEALAHLTRA